MTRAWLKQDAALGTLCLNISDQPSIFHTYLTLSLPKHARHTRQEDAHSMASPSLTTSGSLYQANSTYTCPAFHLTVTGGIGPWTLYTLNASTLPLHITEIGRAHV